MAETASALLEKVLSGKDPQRLLLVAKGLLPVPPEELIPAQVRLAAHENEEVAREARTALEAYDPRRLAEFLAREAPVEVVDHFAASATHPAVLESVLRRRDLSMGRLVALAPRLQPDLQESLLLRQDAILEEPGILDALETNTELSALARRKILEYREHLLPSDRSRRESDAELEVEEVEAEVAEYSEEEVEEALKAARELPAEGDRDDETGLSEAQIRSLPVPVRLRLSRGATRTLRSILVRDSNPRVAVAVITNNAVSDQEIERIAKSRAVVEDVLETIAKNRHWTRVYPIVHSLVLNPRTPLRVSVKMVGRLSVRDLREVARNRNVPEAVRGRAQSLYKMKAE